MRIATIDIGTNTVLLLVADAQAGRITRVIADAQHIVRLGQGVSAARELHPEAMQRCIDAVSLHLSHAETLQSDRVIVTATSAVRDARNRTRFLALLREATGVTVEILSGDAEARWSFVGAVSGLPDEAESAVAVLDIGGGSTELAVGWGGSVTAHASIDVGCVRLTETHFHKDPPAEAAIAQARDAIAAALPALPVLPRGCTLAGVAGTVTTLAALDLGLDRLDPARISGHALTREAVARLSRGLLGSTVAELRTRGAIDPGRADIIAAGGLILHTFMECRGIERIRVSERGLRYGIALREAKGLDETRSG